MIISQSSRLQTFLPSLEELIATNNQLIALERDFHGLPVLCWADLSYNHIRLISKELVEKTQCQLHGVNRTLNIYLNGEFSQSIHQIQLYITGNISRHDLDCVNVLGETLWVEWMIKPFFCIPGWAGLTSPPWGCSVNLRASFGNATKEHISAVCKCFLQFCTVFFKFSFKEYLILDLNAEIWNCW